MSLEKDNQHQSTKERKHQATLETKTQTRTSCLSFRWKIKKKSGKGSCPNWKKEKKGPGSSVRKYNWRWKMPKKRKVSSRVGAETSQQGVREERLRDSWQSKTGFKSNRLKAKRGCVPPRHRSAEWEVEEEDDLDNAAKDELDKLKNLEVVREVKKKDCHPHGQFLTLTSVFDWRKRDMEWKDGLGLFAESSVQEQQARRKPSARPQGMQQ